MNIRSTESPSRVLARFFEAMAQWELETSRSFEHAKVNEYEIDPHRWKNARLDSDSALRRIEEQFCTASALKERRRFSTPPEYDAARQEIVEERRLADGRAIVLISDHLYRDKVEYVLVSEDGHWRVSGRRRVGVAGDLEETDL